MRVKRDIVIRNAIVSFTKSADVYTILAVKLYFVIEDTVIAVITFEPYTTIIVQDIIAKDIVIVVISERYTYIIVQDIVVKDDIVLGTRE